MNRLSVLLPFGLAACALAGCCVFNDDNHFRGQGELTVSECWPFQNYVVKLGSWRTGETAVVRRTFTGLPEMNWVAGFAVDNPDRLSCEALRESAIGDVVVDLTLTRDGQPLLGERAPLRDWIWTWGGSGEGQERCDVYSRKTYFTATHSERYECLAEVDSRGHTAPTLFPWVKTYAVYTP